MTDTAAPVRRKLTTILAADAEGFSQHMGANEVGTLQELRRARRIFSRFIERHDGRIANTAGDGLIAEFPSVVEAVNCAIEVQRELSGENGGEPNALRFRIGLHLGDVVMDGDDLLGDGVNLAARLQSMAEPGGILLSQQVFDQVHSKLSVGFEFLGEQRPRNFVEDVPIYRVTTGGFPGVKKMRAQFRNATARQAKSSGGVEEAEDAQQRENFVSTAKRLGGGWLVLLVLDIITGDGLFAHWPGLALLAYLGWHAVPVLTDEPGAKRLLRMAVILGILTLINIFSWSGTLWVVYPALAVAFMALVYRGRRNNA